MRSEKSPWANMDLVWVSFTRSSLSILRDCSATASYTLTQLTVHPLVHPLLQHRQQREASSLRVPYKQMRKKVLVKIYFSSHIMVITMRTVFITFLISRHIFSKSFLAFLANKGHLCRFPQRMGLRLAVTFSTVIPLFAAGRPYRDLSIQNVFATVMRQNVTDTDTHIDGSDKMQYSLPHPCHCAWNIAQIGTNHILTIDGRLGRQRSVKGPRRG